MSKLLLACGAASLAVALGAQGPCDIYDAAPEGTPCVAAHSTVRALYGKYGGPLYQVKRADGALKNITVLVPGGFADSAAQDEFCVHGGTPLPVESAAGYVLSEGQQLQQAPPPMPAGCVSADAHGPVSFKWAGGVVFPQLPHHGFVTTDSAASCCAKCQSFKNCTFWTFEHSGTVAKPTCYDQAGACCYLRTAAAWAARTVGDEASVSGSTKPLPVAPPPPPCVIQRIFDQSSMGNHLDIAPPGGAHRREDVPVNAAKEKLMVGGHPVYAAYFEGGQGYRIDITKGVAKGNAPETMYAVFNGKHYNGGCCFDYGNAESNNLDTGAASMEAIYFGNSSGWGHGAGKGPWIMADLENGLWAGNAHDYEGNTPMTSEYVTAMVKGGTNGFALKGGDAQQGALRSLYDGPRPARYQPMKKQGSIILGIGGDNSDSAHGTFYEGVMTSGYASNATDALIQANVVAAGYGH